MSQVHRLPDEQPVQRVRAGAAHAVLHQGQGQQHPRGEQVLAGGRGRDQRYVVKKYFFTYNILIFFSRLVDAATIPAPANVHYEKSTRRASSTVDDTQLHLTAKIELENDDGTWR